MITNLFIEHMMNTREENEEWLKSLPISVMEVLANKKATGKVRMSKEEYEKYSLDFKSLTQSDQNMVREYLTEYNRMHNEEPGTQPTI